MSAETVTPAEAPPDPEAVAAESRQADKPPRPKSRRGGARPGSGRKPKAETQKAKNDALAKALSDILSVPAIPCAMAGHPWPAEHFASSAPAFARTLVDTSEQAPALRALLERAVTGGTYAAVAIGAFGYAVPPVIYFLTANDAPARSLLGVPPRPGGEAPRAGAAMNGSADGRDAETPPPATSRPA